MFQHPLHPTRVKYDAPVKKEPIIFPLYKKTPNASNLTNVYLDDVTFQQDERYALDKTEE